ncbi:hypothetical protein LZ31DRAFT_538364 [Colletotrichum somersetense]|nr:hypothetical protein LZ31DRAFT_538364 [Colletotrichum somersetense]
MCLRHRTAITSEQAAYPMSIHDACDRVRDHEAALRPSTRQGISSFTSTFILALTQKERPNSRMLDSGSREGLAGWRLRWRVLVTKSIDYYRQASPRAIHGDDFASVVRLQFNCLVMHFAKREVVMNGIVLEDKSVAEGFRFNQELIERYFNNIGPNLHISLSFSLGGYCSR